MTTFIVLSAIYLASALLMYVWIRIAYSKKGRFYGLNTDWTDAFAIFVPIINTVFCIYGWGWENPYKEQ